MTREQIHIGDMSHETAIGILKLMLEFMETYDGISPTPERVNAVKMAIEALENDPLIVPIAEIKYDEDKLKELVNKAVLSVTPQERKGHWIENAPQYDMLNPQYICSECGNAHTRTTPYCEMCGAKMIEPQESEG